MIFLTILYLNNVFVSQSRKKGFVLNACHNKKLYTERSGHRLKDTLCPGSGGTSQRIWHYVFYLCVFWVNWTFNGKTKAKGAKMSVGYLRVIWKAKDAITKQNTYSMCVCAIEKERDCLFMHTGIDCARWVYRLPSNHWIQQASNNKAFMAHLRMHRYNCQ